MIDRMNDRDFLNHSFYQSIIKQQLVPVRVPNHYNLAVVMPVIRAALYNYNTPMYRRAVYHYNPMWRRRTYTCLYYNLRIGGFNGAKCHYGYC
jgi:hypothetical protein